MGRGVPVPEGSREAGQQQEMTLGLRRIVLLKPKNNRVMFCAEGNDPSRA